MKYWVAWACLFFVHLMANASTEVVEILAVSASKKSIIIDLGTLDGIDSNDEILLYNQSTNQENNRPELKSVAEAEVIKTYDNYSYWFLKVIDNFNLIKAGERLVIARKGKDPRRPLVLRQTKVLAPHKVPLDTFKKNYKRRVPVDLIFEEQKFFPSSELNQTKVSKRQDIETRRFGRWAEEEKKDWDDQYMMELENLYPEEKLNKVVDGDKIRAKRESIVFNATAKGAVKKVNESEGGLIELYQHSARSGQSGLKSGGGQSNVYRQVIEDNRAKEVDPRAKEKIKRDGKMFSAYMSDEELRRFYAESGLEYELNRQKRALHEKEGHEFTLKANFGMQSKTTDEGEGQAGNDFGFSAGFEFHLGATSTMLTKFTAEVEYEKESAYFDIGGLNAKYSGTAFKTHINLYFYNPPQSLAMYMPYFGVGFKRGSGVMTSEFLSADYQYQYQAMPTFKLGMKYRFKAGDSRDEYLRFGVGVNAFLAREFLNLSLLDTPLDPITEKIQTIETRFGLGMSFYF